MGGTDGEHGGWEKGVEKGRLRKYGKRGDQPLPEAGRRKSIHVSAVGLFSVIPGLVSDRKEWRVSGIHALVLRTNTTMPEATPF